MFKKGDIVYTIYSYNRISVSFYVVNRTSAKSIWLYPVGKQLSTKTWAPSWYATPDVNKVDTTREIRKLNRDGYVNMGDYVSELRKWDGNPIQEISD